MGLVNQAQLLFMKYEASWMSGTSLVGGSLSVVAVVSIAWVVRRRNTLQHNRRGLSRSWSFTSAAMAIGVFPEEVQAPATVINAAIYFENLPTNEELVKQVVEPMLEYERLSSIFDPQTYTVKPCPSIDPRKLIRTISVPSHSDKTTNEIIVENMQNCLQTRGDLPWWEWLVVDHQAPSQPSACVLRIHHALADGVSLVSVFERIITTEDGSPVASLMAQNLQDKANKARTKRSFSLWSYLRDFVRVLVLGMTRFDAPTVFSKPNRRKVHSQTRQCVVFPTVPLEFIKALKNAANVSVNDILMTAVSQAIHDYCRDEDCPVLLQHEASTTTKDKKDQAVPPLQSRALLPVALPRSRTNLTDPTTALRNGWCLVSTDFAVGEMDILSRLQSIHTATTALKSSPIAGIQLALQNNVADKLPVIVGQKTCQDIFSRHSLVFSNVPGPNQACKLAGCKASGVQMMFGNLIPQVGFLSYNGKIYGNMVLDPTALPQSERLGGLYGQALVNMAGRLGVEEKKIPAEL